MIGEKPFTLRLNRSLIESKLVAVESDLGQPQLGLSQASLELLRSQVSIIFHVAASVKFEAPLEVNMRHNVVATKELLNLACTFQRLLCFVHVSTAYSNCQLRQIDERVYPMEVPEEPMTLQVSKSMIDGRPNTYTYTKAMAESIANQYADRMNIVIVRPSIVMLALKEPTEGWVDTINGPVGLSILGALGILQKIKVNSEVVFDLIPVDIVSNALVSIAWASTEKSCEFSSPSSQIVSNNNNNHPKGKVRVFNLTTGTENPCSFYQYFSTGREEAYKRPSSRALRPLLKIPKQKGMNPVQYWIHKVFSHLLFAYIIDTLLSVLGQKRMVIKAVNKMHHANEVFDYFCSNQWTFGTDNVKRLRELQTSIDRVTFNCDVRAINWNEYAKIGWLGCRRFILKEKDDTFHYAKLRYQAICFFYYIVKVVLLATITTVMRYCINSPALLAMLLLPIYGVVYLL